MNLDTLFDASAAARNKEVEGVTIRRPDDWHVHLRDGAMLRAVLPFTARAIRPRHHHAEPGAAGDHGGRRRRLPDRILAARPPDSDFEPLMTCYLTDTTSPDEIEKGHSEQVLGRRQALSRRRHHQRASRRDRHQRACVRCSNGWSGSACPC